jgi:hypothetical protein
MTTTTTLITRLTTQDHQCYLQTPSLKGDNTDQGRQHAKSRQPIPLPLCWQPRRLLAGFHFLPTMLTTSGPPTNQQAQCHHQLWTSPSHQTPQWTLYDSSLSTFSDQSLSPWECQHIASRSCYLRRALFRHMTGMHYVEHKFVMLHANFPVLKPRQNIIVCSLDV